MVHCTKLNKLLFSKLLKLDRRVYAWTVSNLPGIPARNVDATVGNHLQGMIKVVYKGGVLDEELERLDKRKRDSYDIEYKPCKHWPAECRKEKRCRFIHFGQH